MWDRSREWWLPFFSAPAAAVTCVVSLSALVVGGRVYRLSRSSCISGMGRLARVGVCPGWFLAFVQHGQWMQHKAKQGRPAAQVVQRWRKAGLLQSSRMPQEPREPRRRRRRPRRRQVEADNARAAVAARGLAWAKTATRRRPRSGKSKSWSRRGPGLLNSLRKDCMTQRLQLHSHVQAQLLFVRRQSSSLMFSRCGRC
jgi:hypothetical protein